MSEKANRRRFTVEYKERILREAAACKERGDVGALLRREGLYSSLIDKWKRAAAKSATGQIEAKKRGPEAKPQDEAQSKRIRELEHELKQEKRRVERLETMLEIQKKVAELLGQTLPESNVKES